MPAEDQYHKEMRERLEVVEKNAKEIPTHTFRIDSLFKKVAVLEKALTSKKKVAPKSKPK